MKNRFHWWLAACVLLLLGISFALPARSDATSRPGFTEADQAYYLEDEAYVFIRPGLVLTLLDFEIPSDLHPLVTFSVKSPDGLPLDLNGSYTIGAINMRFTMAYIPEGSENKVNYFGAGGSDRNGTFTQIEPGTYTYKFDQALPADYDTGATTTMAMSARRTVTEANLGGSGNSTAYRWSQNVVYNFIPSGNGTPDPRDIVRTETCNKCHNPLAMHGANYVQVQMCTQCHNPQLVDDGLSYTLPAVVHRVHSNNEPLLDPITYPTDINDCRVCHVGGTPTEEQPMVVDPNPITACGTGFGMTTIEWSAEGPVEVRLNAPDGKLFASGGPTGSAETGNWVTDGKQFFLVDKSTGETLQKQNVNLTPYGCVTNPPYAYPGQTGAWHSHWMTDPNRVACGGCHVEIDWESGEGHDGGPQDSDMFCSFCHQAYTGKEYDRSVFGAHIPDLASDSLGGVIVNIKSVTNTGPGQSPTVLFSLQNKYGPLDPAKLGTAYFTLTGPNSDFVSYVRESILGKLVQVGNNWSYTFSAKVPNTAKGSYSVAFEGRINSVVLANGASVRDSAENYDFAVAVTDPAAVPRRKVVDDAKCEACHSNLSLHGDNRKNATEFCQTCHRPNATDEEVRTSGIDESIHFKYMIHKIHRGEELENGFVVYGFGSSVHDYGEVTFPGDLRDCTTCHLAGTYQLPTPPGAQPTESPNTYITEMPPMTASCLSCHDGLSAASHADANTSPLGESCDVCHGNGKTYAVDRVHAR